MITPPDPARFTQLRHRMVEEQLRARSIDDKRVLDAMRDIPRHRFVPDDMQAVAYEDRALPIGRGQTISQPYMVAAMTATLRVEPTHRVLEVGTGSGYQAAVLGRLAEHVYTVERIESLAREAEARLRDLGVTNVSIRVDDGTLGWPEHAPFDRILVTAGAPDVPKPLLNQLVDGGAMVLPIGKGETQILTIVQRDGARLTQRPSMACRFVPLIGQAGWDE